MTVRGEPVSGSRGTSRLEAGRLKVVRFRPPRMRRPAPRWVAVLFGAGAILLVPWTVYLGLELPERNVSVHWGLTWVGFDCVLLLALTRTAWLAWRGRRQVELPAVATGTLLLVDAWFDVTTATPGWDVVQALLSAALVEVPMAILAFWIARHVELVCNRRSVIARRDTTHR